MRLFSGALTYGRAYNRSLISSLQKMRLLLGGAYYRKFTVFLEKSHFLKKEPKGPKNRFFEPLWKIDSLVFAINDLKWWFLWLPNFPLHDKQVEILFWGLPATVKLEKLNFWHQLEITFFWKYSDGIKLYIYSNDKVTFGVKSCVYIYTNYQNRGVGFRENLEI